MFIFNREMGKKLAALRVKANLTQKEIAMRVGIAGKFGRGYIARLENGLIKNPSIRTMLDYLLACGVTWGSFFNELDSLYSKKRHKELMSQIKLPDDAKLQKKIDRDVRLYSTKIKGMPKPIPIDIFKVKEKIKNKVLAYLAGHSTDKKLIPTYLDYTEHIFKREINPNPNPPLDNTPWIKSGIRPILFTQISRIVHKTVWDEKKKISKQKPLPVEKQDKMTLGFAKHRVKIEPIEAVVHQVLCQIVIPEVLYPAYKAYTRECYKVLKKHYKDPILLKQKLSEVTRTWTAQKLNPEILEKIKDRIFGFFNI